MSELSEHPEESTLQISFSGAPIVVVFFTDK
jgi:hypothetical protein